MYFSARETRLLGYTYRRKIQANVLPDDGTCYQFLVNTNVYRREPCLTTGLIQKHEAVVHNSRTPETTAMVPSDQRRPETTSHREFRHNLQLLEVITSWHLWGGAVMIMLLPATIISLALPLLFTQLGLSYERYSSLVVQGLLGLMWIVSGFTLYHQRHRLKMLRKGLVEQMDGATKNRRPAAHNA